MSQLMANISARDASKSKRAIKIHSQNLASSSERITKHNERLDFCLLASIRRVTVTIATLRLTSTSASSLVSPMRSQIPSFQCILALASVLMLLLYIDHVASRSADSNLILADSGKFLMEPSISRSSMEEQRFSRHRQSNGRSSSVDGTPSGLNRTRNWTSDQRYKSERISGSSSIHRVASIVEHSSRRSDLDSDQVSQFAFEPTRKPTEPLSSQPKEKQQVSSRSAYVKQVNISTPINFRGNQIVKESRSFSSISYHEPSNMKQRLNDIPKLPVSSPSDHLTFRYADAIVEPTHSKDQTYRGSYVSSQRHWKSDSRINPNRNQYPRRAIKKEPQADTASARMYKKVLICDKTLVSLDYMKNIPSKSSESKFGYEFIGNSIGLDENYIDLDSGFEEFFSDRRRMSNSTLEDDQSSASIEYDNSKYGDIDRHQQSYPLADEDPLVRCDMWDLEKGLKNRKPPQNLLRIAIKTDFNTVRDAINRCRQLSEKNLPPEDEFRDGIEVPTTEDMISMFSIKRGLIPGTKWCGLGDIASSYNDLGLKRRIDICCRAHDHCPIRLKPFRNDYGVFNIALYTKSHCDCDADFYRCLREAHSKTADMLGNLYFNVMKLQCLREEPMKLCREIK